MTGFARAAGEADARAWAWEIKSVNGRGLELRLRLPQGFDYLEPACRKAAAARLGRGNITANLTVASDETAADFVVNEANLNAALAAVAALQAKLPCEKPRPEGVLALRGVIQQENSEPDDATKAKLGEALMAGFETALDGLNAAREDEGAKLKTVLAEQLAAARGLHNDASAASKDALPQFKKRLEAQLNELLTNTSINKERLAEEASLLAVKADVREELDRLAAHLDSAMVLLEADGPVGRKFDFLIQEFNREANTLCSKAPDMTLKEIGLALKTVIDQMREQVQNVE